MVVHDTSPAARALLVLEMIQDSPGHHGRPARRPARALRPRHTPARGGAARGRHPGRVDPGALRRLPDRPRAAAAAADVHPDRGARAGDGRARGSPGRGGRPGRAGAGQDRARAARAARPPRRRRTTGARPRLGRRRTGRRASTVRLVQAVRRRRAGAAALRRRRPAGDVGHRASTRGRSWSRHRRWYLLGWSHDKDARRVLRVDRVRAIEVVDAPAESVTRRRPTSTRSRRSRSSCHRGGATRSRSSSTRRSSRSGTGSRAASVGSRPRPVERPGAARRDHRRARVVRRPAGQPAHVVPAGRRRRGAGRDVRPGGSSRSGGAAAVIAAPLRR